MLKKTCRWIAAGALAGLGLAAQVAGAATCERPARVFKAGREAGALCPAEARAAGLTVVDLRDGWVPYPFAGAAEEAGVDPPEYGGTLVELANGRFGADALAESDRYLELYGVAPSLQVVYAALSDDARHRCHDAIDDAALDAVRVPLWPESRAKAAERRDALKLARRRLEVARARRGARSNEELVALAPAYAKTVRNEARLAAVEGAIAAVQAHLACDGLLARPSPAFDWNTVQALAKFQRRNWIVAGGQLDEDTRAALVSGSRELDVQLALRALRWRVTDAAGLIEDGSAGATWGTVLGRQLDRPDMRFETGYPPLADAAPDRVSPATEAAAVALGWRDFATIRASLAGLLAAGVRTVAVPLPPAPAYHRRPLELRAVIDRGADGRRPVLILFARTGGRDLALVRWPTTVGGLKDEKLPSGAIVKKRKESDLGPRVWRDLVVAPVWYPPPSTPDRELVAQRSGRWSLKEDLIGPGYRSAYGLAMLIHHKIVAHSDHVHEVDHGIRTHGSVSYRSILAGDSHGCHRLYNHHALRLVTFLLRYREYAARGLDPEILARKVRWRGRAWTIHRKDRGYRYELTPPVPVDVVVGFVERACEA